MIILAFNILLTMPLSAVVVGGAGWIGKAISVADVERLLAAAAVDDGPRALRDRALLEVLYGTGARIITLSTKKPLLIIYKEIGTLRIGLAP